MEIVLVIIGTISGVIIGWLVGKQMAAKDNVNYQSQLQSAQQRVNDIQVQFDGLKSDAKNQQQEIVQLNQKLMTAQAESQHLQKKVEEKQEELGRINLTLTNEFKNIAQEIIEQKGKLISEDNKNNLNLILDPLKEKIKSFEDKVSQSHLQVMRDNSALREQLQGLAALNQTIGKEAQNLVNALKGSSKTQGNWGEFILERILEKSGLQRDSEYKVQASFTDEDGRRFQPDVVVMLPENKSIVIDSKVSLVAYEQYCSTDDEVLKKKYILEHIASMRSHMKGLGEKAYQQLYELNSVDFVIMFVPVESAFALVIQESNDLWSEAFERNIVLVSTSTLLATLRTIAMMWRQDRTNKNAFEIARLSGEMYEKFNSFLDDMTKVGRNMQGAQTSYEDAMKKLYTGRGNVIKRLEDIKRLGANTNKALPQALVDRAEE